MRAILSLLTNILITGTSIIGTCTIINKVGKFFKIIEDTKEDGFKIAFDNFMMDSIDDLNKCVESISTIALNTNNVIIIVYDIIVGNKFVKKNKDGKIIICGKDKLYSGYKDKIDELSIKVKKYQDELKKIKKDNLNKNNNDDNNNDDNNDDDSLCSSISSDGEDNNISESSISEFSMDAESSVSTSSIKNDNSKVEK
jgi:hypothetical protein